MIERLGLLVVVVMAALTISATAAAGGNGKEKNPKPEPTWVEVYGTPTLTLSEPRQISKDELARATGDATVMAFSSPCWTREAMYGTSGWWGYWELGQVTNWCHNGNVITYRYTQARPARAGGACSVSQGTWFYKNGGGVNDWYVDVRAGASFSCFVGWNSGSPWFEMRYTQGGSYWQVAGSTG